LDCSLLYYPSDHIQATAITSVCTVSPIQTTHHSVSLHIDTDDMASVLSTYVRVSFFQTSFQIRFSIIRLKALTATKAT